MDNISTDEYNETPPCLNASASLKKTVLEVVLLVSYKRKGCLEQCEAVLSVERVVT